MPNPFIGEAGSSAGSGVYQRRRKVDKLTQGGGFGPTCLLRPERAHV
jgi:hypothetical protein